MKNLKVLLGKSITKAVAVAFILSTLIPLTQFGTAQAITGALITNRSIEMSSSVASATATYSVTFTPGTSGPLAGIVIDFCDNSPIINDSCTYTGGQSITTTGAAIGTTVAGDTGGGSWSIYSKASPLIILNDSSAATDSTGTPITFTLTGLVNPAYTPTCTNGTVPNCTFYARILTYATALASQSYAPASTATAVDAGGIALSTNSQITITAKVQEQLNFCVYTNANCAAAGNTVTLGYNNGVLSTTNASLDVTTKFSISTNAAHNAIINMEGTTLTSPGSYTIPAIGSTAAGSTPGTGQFGMCVENPGGNLTTITYATYYGGGNCSGLSLNTPGSATFGFNTTNTTSTYGDTIASQAPGAASIGTLAFLGNIPTTQTAGIYTTTLTFIATGTY